MIGKKLGKKLDSSYTKFKKECYSKSKGKAYKLTKLKR
jgi:hypothetical protein